MFGCMRVARDMLRSEEEIGSFYCSSLEHNGSGKLKNSEKSLKLERDHFDSVGKKN